MNPIVSAAILPHGDVIPELAGPQAQLTHQTHLAMTEVGRRMAEARPEIIVLATPHGLRVEGQIGISLTERAVGTLEGRDATLMVDMPVDQHFAWTVADQAEKAGVPVARCVFGTSSGPESKLPLDWGAIVPLYYCGADATPSPRIVVVVPSRGVDDLQLVEFGRAVTRAARESGKRVAFIASCDWAHAQSADGPYGYHPDAAKYDLMVQDIIRRNDLKAFLGVDHDFIENAKPDGNWQALILAGALEGSSLQPEILSYQCPTYFGMLVASYR